MKGAIRVAAGVAVSVCMFAGATVAKQPKPQSDRWQAVYQLVKKWGPVASRTQGRSVAEWADSMVPLFGTADPDNLKRALGATTYRGMVDALTGTRAPSTAKLVGPTPASLGSLSSELVFTPLPSCVIVNTTKAGGAMTPGSTRHFKASGASFTTQGGEASNCGIPAGVKSLLASVTSAGATSSGYFRVWPYATPQPLAANMSFTSGQVIQNEIVMATSTGLASDFSVYSTGGSHLIINVLGYFAAPVATALDCTIVTAGPVNVAEDAAFDFAASCPAGRTATGGGFSHGLSGDPWLTTARPVATGFHVSGYNLGGYGAAEVSAHTTCCRIPGR